MEVLPEKLCTTVALGSLATTYDIYVSTPTSTRKLNPYASKATCEYTRSRANNDTFSISVTAVVWAETDKAVSDQKQEYGVAKRTDPNMIVLTGIGEEAFAARALTQPVPGIVEYTIEARDGNLRLTVQGKIAKANRQPPGDEQVRQFARDLAEVTGSILAKLGNG
jgi:hypothetical protein